MDGERDIITAEAERLARRAAETGDPRLLHAAAILSDADHRAYRRDWGWRTQAQRDKAIREIAARFFPGGRPTPTAKEIARRMRHYAGTGWPRDRHAVSCPPRIVDTIDGALWSLWMDCGHQILGERRVFDIISH